MNQLRPRASLYSPKGTLRRTSLLARRARFIALALTGMLFGSMIIVKNLIRLQSPFQRSNLPVANARGDRIISQKNETSLKSSQKDEIPQLYYKLANSTILSSDKNLQTIVDSVVEQVKARGLPVGRLSICLIDIHHRTVAGYQAHIMHYPASLSKLFWLVAFYAQLDAGLLKFDNNSQQDLLDMIQDSDNEAASRIVDQLTKTRSGIAPSPQDYTVWRYRREWFNRFFQQAEYRNINLSQKNFPIPYLGMKLPEGFDKQLQGTYSENPVRNQISAYQAARLLYEIAEGRAISQPASRSMMQLLKRDLQPEAWKLVEDNAVEGFLGEGLSPDTVDFVSKVGFTTQSRQEVALIQTKDGQVAYVLAILAENPLYSNDWEIFPVISQAVFAQMSMIASNSAQTIKSN